MEGSAGNWLRFKLRAARAMSRRESTAPTVNFIPPYAADLIRPTTAGLAEGDYRIMLSEERLAIARHPNSIGDDDCAGNKVVYRTSLAVEQHYNNFAPNPGSRGFRCPLQPFWPGMNVLYRPITP